MKHLDPIQIRSAEQTDPPADLAAATAAVTELREAASAFETRQGEALAAATARIQALETRLNRPNVQSGAEVREDVERRALASFARSGDETEMRAASTASPADGGYLVLPTLEAGIRNIARDISPLRALASVVTVSTDSYEVIVDASEVESGWIGEDAERPETDGASFHKTIIPVFETYAAPRVTQKLLDDANMDLGAHLEGKIGARFAAVEGNAFALGNGTDRPKGILTYTTAATADFTRAWGQFQHIAAGATPTDAQLADALIKLSLTLRVPYRPNATWLMSRETALRIRQIKDTNGKYVWQDGLQAGQPDRLCGFPIAYDDAMPAIGANTLPIALADWKQAYQIVDRHGMRVIRDNVTVKPFTIFYAYRRVGGGAVDFNALKFLKIAAA